MKSILRDLEIEKRMDKVANEATKKANQQPIEVPIIKKKPKRISLTLDPVNLDKRDLEIERRMDIKAKEAAALNGNEIIAPMETGITPEMIEQNRQDELASKSLVLPPIFYSRFRGFTSSKMYR
jgi:hypothetical protein